MHAHTTYKVDPMSPEERHALRLLARSDRSFDAVAGRACRLGFLSASLLGLLDPEAALGLALAEAEALLALARLPARTPAELRIKDALFRSWRSAARHDVNLAAMLEAAHAADAGRLASDVANRRRCREARA